MKLMITYNWRRIPMMMDPKTDVMFEKRFWPVTQKYIEDLEHKLNEEGEETREEYTIISVRRILW